MTLLHRLAQAKGPDRELAREVARLVGWHRVEPRHTSNRKGGWIAPEDWNGTMSDGSPILDGTHGTTIHRDVPDYTASLDAVLRLLPEGWGVHMSMCENNTYKHPLVKLWSSYPVNRNVFGEADTLPIALLIAILRARGIE